MSTAASSDAAASGDVVIEMQGVGKQFDDVWVLNDVDVQIAAGTIVGLIGPSGSGKTTMIKTLNGSYSPDAGTVTVFGSDPVLRPRAERARIGYLPQQPVLFDNLSLRENLSFHASLNGVPLRGRRQRFADLLELVELDGHDKKLVNQASGGMQRRLALAAALVHDPSLVILDEPTAGIDPILRRRFWEHFRAARDEDRTLLICTQYVDEAVHCDVVGLLADGRLIAFDTPDELRRRAFGGDRVDIEFTRIVSDSDLRRCRTISGVVGAEFVGSHTARVVLDPRSSAREELTESVIAPDDDAVGVADVPPEWDDIFIRLVEAERSVA